MWKEGTDKETTAGDVPDPVFQPLRFRFRLVLNSVLLKAGKEGIYVGISVVLTLESLATCMFHRWGGVGRERALGVARFAQVGTAWCSKIVCRTLGRHGPRFQSCLWPVGLGPWAKSEPSLWCCPSAKCPPYAGHSARKLPSVPSVQLRESGRRFCYPPLLKKRKPRIEVTRPRSHSW